MIDLLLISIAAGIFGLKFSVGYIIPAIVGLLIGLMFGGLSLLIKLIPALLLVFAVPIGLAFYFSWPFDLFIIAISSGSLFVGYLIGSLLAVVLLPLKLLSKFFKFVLRIFNK